MDIISNWNHVLFVTIQCRKLTRPVGASALSAIKIMLFASKQAIILEKKLLTVSSTGSVRINFKCNIKMSTIGYIEKP